MTDVRVTPLEPSAYGVEIDEGGLTTGHRMIVPPDFWESWDVPQADEATLVEQTVQFLLERGPSTSIPDEISLDQVVRQHADFTAEITTRLSV